MKHHQQDSRKRRRRVDFRQEPSTGSLHVEVLPGAEAGETSPWEATTSYRSKLLWLRSSVLACAEQNDNFRFYLELLAQSYLTCAADQATDLSPEHVSLLGVVRGDARGLETQALPGMGQDRLKRRKKHTRSIVDLYSQLRSVPCLTPLVVEEMVREASLEHSRCSRRFAQTLGVADTIAALIEHAEPHPSAVESVQEHLAAAATKLPFPSGMVTPPEQPEATRKRKASEVSRCFISPVA